MKVLLIITVEDSVKNVNLIRNNYKILQNYNEITWCFNHFDGTNKEWNKESWYNNMNCIKNIGIGSKITQWKKITPNISKLYDYLWFLDGDMGLEEFNWKSYYNMLNTILKCSKDKWYNGIENGTPFISTKIWDLIYEKMILTDPRSTWETVLFYNKIANDLNSPKLINFFSPVVHHDFRNLNKIKSVDAKRELIISPDPDDYKTKILNLFNII